MGMMKIVWSKEAEFQVLEIAEWLEQNRSFQLAQNFHKRLWETIWAVQKMPAAGQSNPKSTIRYKLIDKNRRLYYSIEESKGEIFIEKIWDARQDPGKLKF